MIPINLKDLFGDRYRVSLDESAKHEPGGRSDPWHYLIPCGYGSISPFSAELLAFHCTARGIRTRLHREQPQIEAQNWSDDGQAIFLLQLDQFELVAKYARPRRKRPLSEKQRQIQVERLRAHRFKPKMTQVKAAKTARNGAISKDSTPSMASAEIGDSGAQKCHFTAGKTS